jgi:hypothetical protein
MTAQTEFLLQAGIYSKVFPLHFESLLNKYEKKIPRLPADVFVL